jgi:hypothetical protein
MQSILVIFQATRQHIEGLALAFGLGAVQTGANIRLRHLDPSPSAELAHAGYGTLRTDDLRWAEGVAILLESPHPAHLGALEAALKEAAEISNTAETVANQTPARKWAYLFHETPEAESQKLVQSLLELAGYRQFSDPPHLAAANEAKHEATHEAMTRMGRQFAGMAIETS